MKKRILITGADGFIGSHLTELMFEQGHEVRALAMYNSFNNWGWLEDINCKDKIEIISGDIRDPNFCKVITKNIDIVFHLAALIGIPYSYIAPDSYIQTNVQGTLNLCQASLDNQVEKFIHTSTSEVYGTAKYIPIDEEHPLQPQSPYSASKIAADAMAKSFYNSFDLPLVVARPFNTYGPRQSARAIIPSIIIQIASGKKTIELGDLSPTRDFNYVKDTCRAFNLLATKDSAIGETINIGSNSEISIHDTLELIKRMMNSNVEVIVDKKRIRPNSSEVFRLFSDNKKIKKLTGYQAEVCLEDGLEKTINWILNPKYLETYKSDIYNV
ncbi:NAD-dependent 4,6-dehydratase LegB [Candidatus Pseudothioglobus singularis]|nr:NAD-dependent 4,6-dehydratase LegB [Candidatus Pseudothioglobus singularis]